MDELATSAVAAAVEVASQYFPGQQFSPQILKDGSNAMIHLAPLPIVARVPTTSSWIRRPVERWLARDLDLALYLLEQGCAVVAPATEVPAGPHVSSPATGSMAMTFWRYVEQDREQPATDDEAAAALHSLHQGLKAYRGDLPFMGVLLEELPHWLHWLEQNRVLPGSDLLELRQAQWTLANTLHGSRLPMQAVHGDAHSGNLLRTPQGLLWLDFEDACIGPLAWDVATLVSRSLLAGNAESAERLLEGYPEAPGWQELAPYLQARELEGVVYFQVLAKRFPARAAEAAAALAAWYRKWNS